MSSRSALDQRRPDAITRRRPGPANGLAQAGGATGKK
jgi:hypothetical protein